MWRNTFARLPRPLLNHSAVEDGVETSTSFRMPRVRAIEKFRPIFDRTKLSVASTKFADTRLLAQNVHLQIKPPDCKFDEDLPYFLCGNPASDWVALLNLNMDSVVNTFASKLKDYE